MMSRIVDYHKKISRNLSLSFVDNRLFCSIPYQKDLFEPQVFETISAQSLYQTLEPVLLFTDIVEDLDLNLRIWLKA